MQKKDNWTDTKSYAVKFNQNLLLRLVDWRCGEDLFLIKCNFTQRITQTTSRGTPGWQVLSFTCQQKALVTDHLSHSPLYEPPGDTACHTALYTSPLVAQRVTQPFIRAPWRHSVSHSPLYEPPGGTARHTALYTSPLVAQRVTQPFIRAPWWHSTSHSPLYEPPGGTARHTARYTSPLATQRVLYEPPVPRLADSQLNLSTTLT